MAVPSNQDSNLAFDFGAAAGEGRYQSPGDLRPEDLLRGAAKADEMLVLDLASTGPLPELDEAAGAFDPRFVDSVFGGENLSTSEPSSEPPPVVPAAGELWLDGDVLLCACPDCRAPMTVRLWLMVADCWLCGVSVELTEEQERQAQRLLAERRARSATAGEGEPARQRQVSAEVGRAPSSRRETIPPPAIPQAPRSPSRRVAGERLRRPESILPYRLLQSLFDYAPAWLISLIVHCILLTLLAMFTVDRPVNEGPVITLSTSVARVVREGEEQLPVRIGDVEFDLPIPRKADLNDERVREVLLAADQDAREIRLDSDAVDPNLPELAQVKKQVGAAHGAQRVFAARDPRLRAEMVAKEGGTTLTEAAVARGLRWLARNQHADGGWKLHEHEGMLCDSAGASLALLPFLGAGQTHLSGRYQDTVAQGLKWLVDHQRPDGDLRAGTENNAGMYAHGQGAIVLCEAYLMTGDEALRDPAQRAINFICDAQHVGGGWRYQPGMAGDTSVLGWQIMALASARAGNLEVPEHVLENASNYLDTVSSFEGARYSYLPQSARSPTPSMTAEGLLCRMFLGWNKEQPAIGAGVRFLVEEHLPSRNAPSIYYWYYATQTIHHYGGAEWEQWNSQIRDILVEMQETRGPHAGSWDPVGEHSNVGGRIYMTSLAVCTLEVYYRHLPIFRRIELE